MAIASPTDPETPTAPDLLRNEAWSADAEPAISVVISSYRRPKYLPELVASLEAIELPRREFEVIVVDNGSGDDTWSVLDRLVAGSDLQLTAVRLESNRGPGGGRNAGVKWARAPIIAITDDDCLVTPGWLAGIIRAFDDDGVAVVQGRVQPDPVGLPGAGLWDHTIEIPSLTPWFETANVAYRREAFLGVGGFDERDSLTAQHGGGRAFGEDAVLAWRIIQSGGRASFASDGVVFHRVVSATYRKLLREWRYFVGFPGLVQRSGVAADSLYMGVFLNKETAMFDLAAASVLAAVLLRRPYLILGALPWARRRRTLVLRFQPTPSRLALWLVQRGLLEGVGLASLVQGSVIHRRLVL